MECLLLERRGQKATVALFSLKQQLVSCTINSISSLFKVI